MRDIDTNAAFSPDGKRIAYERFNDPEAGKFSLVIANADGSSEKVVAGGPADAGHRHLSWSPDGKRIALTDVNEAPGPIQLLDVASAKIQDFASVKSFVFYKSAWLPDGRGLFVQYRDVSGGLNRNQIGFVSYPAGQFYAVTKDTNAYNTLTLSADAKTLASVQSKRLFTVYSIPAAGTGANSPSPAIAQQQRGLLSFSWAGNDGFYLADGNQLSRVSSDGSNKTPLLSDASVFSVSACPDGRTLLLAMIASGGGTTVNIWRVNADGTNLKQLSNGLRDLGPECSPDSKWAYYLRPTLAASYACPSMAEHPRPRREPRFLITLLPALPVHLPPFRRTASRSPSSLDPATKTPCTSSPCSRSMPDRSRSRASSILIPTLRMAPDSRLMEKLSSIPSARKG